MTHGTTGYKNGCRCDTCREATSRYKRGHRKGLRTYTTRDDYDNVRDLLTELFPYGLTPDCPAARQQQSQAA